MRKNIYTVFLLAPYILYLLLTGCSTPADNGLSSGITCNSPQAASELGKIFPDNLVEPSGIVFHPLRNTIFVIGDEGDIEEIDLGGQMIKSRRLRSADFEGIAYADTTGLLYVVIEAANTILEVDPETFDIVREFSLNWMLNGADVLKPSDEAIEGITFIADASHRYGGTFLVANRNKEVGDADKPAEIIEIELPLTDIASNSGEVVRRYQPEIAGMSGLHYVQDEDLLFITTDDGNAMFKYSLSAGIVECFDLPGEKQEGVAIDADGIVYIADDKGGSIFRLSIP